MPAHTFALLILSVIAAAALTILAAALISPYVAIPAGLLGVIALAATLLLRLKRP